MMVNVNFATAPGHVRLAYQQDGSTDEMSKTGFFWLGGFMSDMTGSKAEALAALARETRRPSLRFDYSGHGQSEGDFTDGTISAWLEQAIHMFITFTKGKRIVIGSSMGGWLALLLLRVLERDDPAAARRIAGLVLIAPAVDMTSELMRKNLPPQARYDLERHGVFYQPSEYGSPYAITRRLLEDGDHHNLLAQGMEVGCPVRILQGSADKDVPPSHALNVFSHLSGLDITLTLLQGGDHRLSTPTQLTFLKETALQLANRADGLGP